MKLILFFNLFVCYLYGNSLYLQADPFYLFHYELNQFVQSDFSDDLNMRPVYSESNKSTSSLYLNSWYYYNDNAPNLENTSDKWVGKGSNFYKSIHYNYKNDFLIFSIEPFFYTSENLPFNAPLNSSGIPQEHTDPIFLALNENRVHSESPYKSYGIRESQIILHRNDIGMGFSNTNLWWGPGLHNSLHISNNTSGFNYFYLGTNATKRVREFGYNFKYIFSKLDKNIYEPYYTGLAGDISYFGNMITTVGFFRSFLSGGLSSSDDISLLEAMVLPFQSFFKKTLQQQNNNVYPQDDVDQTFSVFVKSTSIENKFTIYLEYGTNDHRWDIYDFFQHPDHSMASILGFRKYNLFKNDNLIFGVEYTNLIQPKFMNRAGNSNWYDKEFYDYNKYNGRRYTAHIGSDADDLLLYFGYLSEINDLILSLNYERHGVGNSIELSSIEYENEATYFHVPEYKIEFKLDYRTTFKEYDIFFIYEFEFLDNLGIPHQGINPRFSLPKRRSNVFGIGFSKNFK